MQTIELWPTNSRIIEVGVTSGSLADRWVRAGFRGYLGIARDERRRSEIVRRYPSLADHVIVSNARKIVRQNNADVLILHGWSILSLCRMRNVRHARMVACEFRPTLLCAAAIFTGILQWLLRRFARPKIIKLGECAQTNDCVQRRETTGRFIVFSVRRTRPHAGARRYIPHSLGVEGFLARLQRDCLRHAVLRWFESLPKLPPGEDLDLLVDDASLKSVRTMLEGGPGVQPVDLYSVTGLPGADFRGMPYYPPCLAEELLDRAVDHRGLCSVPSPREHFLSLAYHALYHKGIASGLPMNETSRPSRGGADHDYASILNRMAAQLNIDVQVDLESLDKYLDSEGWRPPHDMLVRLARHNRWIRSRLEQPDHAEIDHRLAVFLLRRAAMERGGVDRASELLSRHGFRVLAARVIAPALATNIARSIRGGNWGQGPWPVSGGEPMAAIAAYDPAPIAPTRRQKRRFPFLANARLLSKEQIRDAFNEGVPSEQHANVIHSSDNGREALDYLRIVGPDFAAEVWQKGHDLHGGARSLELMGPAMNDAPSQRAAA